MQKVERLKDKMKMPPLDGRSDQILSEEYVWTGGEIAKEKYRN